VLLDVRPEDLYKGEKGAWKRKGHIKGALSHPWAMDLGGDGAWKPKDELLAAYAKQGVTPDKKIIIYCGQVRWPPSPISRSNTAWASRTSRFTTGGSANGRPVRICP